MRVMVKFSFPTVEGNQALKAGRIAKLLPQIIEELKPEAAYFYPGRDGLRSGHFVVDMQDSSKIIEIGERLWFGLGGTVEMVPVMNAEDLQKGLPHIAGIVAKYS